MSSTTTAPTRPTRSRLRARATAVAVAALAATAVWAVAVPVLDTELTVDGWDGATMTVTLALVVVTALIASLAGWAGLALLERWTSRARTIWTAGAALVLVASLGMPATAAATTATAVVLALMHLAVGLVLIPAMARSVR